MKQFLFFICLSLSLLFLDRYKLTWPVRAVVELATQPVKKVLFQTKLKARQTFQNLGKLKEVEMRGRDVEDLKIENEALKKEKEELEEENEAMRKLLNAPLPMDWNFQLAHILGERDGCLVIDQGEREGVKKGMAAVWEKALIGRVEEVSAHSAKMKTPLHGETAILAKTGKASGMVINKKGEIFLTKVLQGEKLEVNEVVATSGVDGVYPPGLLIGRVVEIILSEEQPFKEARLQPMVGYRSLKTVFLVKE